MRTWTRAITDTLCGGVHQEPHLIRKGEPMLVLELPAMKRRPIRCVQCEGPAPPMLAEVVESQRPKLSFATTRDLATDWKAKQADR